MKSRRSALLALLFPIGIATLVVALLARAGDRPGAQLSGTTEFLGRDADGARIAGMAGIELWRFRYEPPPGHRSLETVLRLHRPGEPTREFGGFSTFGELDTPPWAPREVIVGIAVESMTGRHRLRVYEHDGLNAGRSDPIEIPIPFDGVTPDVPIPIAEGEFAIRWSNPQDLRDTPDLTRDRVWTLRIAPVPPERLPEGFRPSTQK